MSSRTLRRALALLVLLLAVGGLVYIWSWWPTTRTAEGPLVLYGNVEVRQVDLAFGVEGPIAEVLVDEGDAVQQGQVLASLDQAAFEFAASSAEATLAGTEQRLAELVAGSRPQEIERARATVAAAEAAAHNATVGFRRVDELFRHGNASQQAFDAAEWAKRSADATLREAQANLALALEGTRPEQLAQQRAEVESQRANLALQRYRLGRATLRAPNAGVVLTRIREPGAVVLPNTPVLTLSLIDPVWIRVYVDEPHLARMVPGGAVTVATDAAPSRSYPGRIGYVSSTAEFTPKSVESPELRTALVYRVRVVVENPDETLRQGMPVTVTVGAPATRRSP